MAIMWRPDLGIYNAFLFNYTSGFKGLEDSSGIIFPLPTLVSNSLQLMLLPWQKDVNDTLVTKAIDPLMCAGAAASVAVLKWSSKGLPPVALPQVGGVVVWRDSTPQQQQQQQLVLAIKNNVPVPYNHC
jgi:hypothetical protein